MRTSGTAQQCGCKAKAQDSNNIINRTIITTINIIILIPVFFNLIVTSVFCIYAMVLHQKTRRPVNDLIQAAETDELSTLHEPARNIDDDEGGSTSRDDFHTSTSAPKSTEDLWHLYESIYSKPTPQGAKSGFTINRGILQMLRDVFWNTKSESTFTAYIENIPMWHLRTYEELLNGAASTHKRYKILNL